MADTHLRAAQYNRRSRGYDFYIAAERAVEALAAKGVQTILHTGDLLDSTTPTPAVMAQVALLRHKAIIEKVQILLISGNHDRTEPHWSEIVGAANYDKDDIMHGKPGLFLVDNKTVKLPNGLTVSAVPYCHSEEFDEVMAAVKPADILMWHGLVKEMAGFPDAKGVSLDQFPTDKFQVIALGDIHIPQIEVYMGATFCYPGSTEMCKRDEPLQKQVAVVDFNSGTPAVEWVDIKTRKFLTLRVDSEEYAEQAVEEARKYASEDPVVLLAYDASLVPDAPSRIYAVLDTSKAIVHARRIDGDSVLRDSSAVIGGDDVRPVSDFIDQFFSANTDLNALCAKLADPLTKNPDRILNEWVDSKLETVE